MSKKPVSWWSGKSLKVPHHVASFGENGRYFINDGDQTHCSKQLIKGRQAGRPQLHESFGELHPDGGPCLWGWWRDRRGYKAYGIRWEQTLGPGCDVRNGGRRICTISEHQMTYVPPSTKESLLYLKKSNIFNSSKNLKCFYAAQFLPQTLFRV